MTLMNGARGEEALSKKKRAEIAKKHASPMRAAEESVNSWVELSWTPRATVAMCARVVFIVVAGLLLTRNAPAAEPKLLSFVLGNGLHVVLLEDHERPRVSVAIAYKAGFHDEPEGYKGIAHLTEHLMFHGSRHIPDDGFSRLLERAGARRLNAHTSAESAIFEEEMPRRNYEVALWAESDRMAYMLDTLASDVVDREKEVIRNEALQRYGERLLAVRATEAAFPSGHPYYRVGAEDDLGSIGLAEVEWFFQTHYRPDNATLALVGDFDPSEAEQHVRRYFDPIVNPGKAAVRRPAPPADLGERRHVFFEGTGRVRSLAMLWSTPRRGERDDLALRLLADCLGQRGSFLRRTLPGPAIGAVGFGTTQSEFGEGSLFSINVDFMGRTETSKVEKLIDIELESLRANPAGTCNASALRDRRIAGLRIKGDPLTIAMNLAAGTPTAESTIRQLSTIGAVDLERAVRWLTPERRLVVEASW